MKSAVLERLETGDHGTFGRIIVDDLILFTGELPWRDNSPNISCIPAGKYTCAWTFSPAFKRMMYAVGPVGGRAGIRIHPANLMGDKASGLRCQLNGCIAIGERLGTMQTQKAILLSAPAVRRLEDFTGRTNFSLEIVQ